MSIHISRVLLIIIAIMFLLLQGDSGHHNELTKIRNSIVGSEIDLLLHEIRLYTIK